MTISVKYCGRFFPGLFLFVAVILLLPCTGAALQLLGDPPSLVDPHPHNLSASGTGTISSPPGSEQRICIFCHTPHSSSLDGALWNRNDPTGPLAGGTFPLYGQLSGRLDEIEIDDIPAAQYGGADYPNGASRLCLSCHDGVTAIGEVINPGRGSLPLGGLGSIEAENPGSNAVIDLDSSHPISFIYTDPVRVAINLVKGGGTDYILPVTPGILDASFRMQCTSCHDPHVDTNNGGAYRLPMWRNYVGVDENADYEATCSECHVGGSGSGGLIRGGGIGGNH